MTQEIQLRVLPEVAADERSLMQWLRTERGLSPKELKGVRILKRSIDARQRIVYVNLTVRIYLNEEPQDEEPFLRTEYECVSGRKEAVVVGAGPGGLFAALKLIELGIRPIVVERGRDVHTRRKDIARISRDQSINPESNYCFGEGGAGAFSDGKLYTRSKKRGSVEKILNVFCQHGAAQSILVDAHPHIGTDRLPGVIEAMRNTIIQCGGEVRFGTRMTGLLIAHGRCEGISAVADEGELELHGPVILATGHSARDVYRWLDANDVAIEAKNLAVGVRLEHPSELIDQIQYHNREGRGKYLPTAEYSYVTQVDGRGVYSFCMCPGGTVVPAGSGLEQVVVNGMSNSHRNSPWSNSGMVVETHVDDVIPLVGDAGALTMLHFQELLERTAWQQAGRKQTAPAQRMADFVNCRLSYDLPSTSYAPGLVSTPIHFWMPEFVVSRLRQGFKQFGRSAHGFLTNEATMIGVETRTSSPVRIVRNRDTLQHVGIEGLFPCGEGAGYAGGIVSAGIDGERCAEMVAQYMGM